MENDCLAKSYDHHVLHSYQEAGVDFIKNTPRCACWWDMGCGKSLTVLTAIAELYVRFDIHRVLVIAPKRVAQHTWPAEIRKWDHLRELSFTVIQGNPAQRRRRLDDESTIHIINRENIPWLVESLGGQWPYDMVVIDEASSFKSSQSKRFKALRKVIHLCDRVVQLTGTPAGNSLLDLWPQLFLLDRGARLGKTFSQFRARYFVPDHMGWQWTIKPGAENKIHAKVADLCLRMSAEDYLELPDRIDHTIEVELPASTSAFYKTLGKEFVLAMTDGDLPVLNAAAQVNKMLQVANGAVYVNEERKYEVLHDAKLDALDSIIEECAGAPVLVAYSYQSDLERIRRRWRYAVDIREPGAIDAWNRGEIPILLAHPASAGHGLNLQSGGNHIVWFGLPWSLELYQQFNARLHRQGQDKPVFICHIQAVDTVEDQVRDALDRKDTTQAALLDAIKEKFAVGAAA